MIAELEYGDTVLESWDVGTDPTGEPYRILHTTEGWRFSHACDRHARFGEPRGLYRFAPLLQVAPVGTGGHTVTMLDPLTIAPSILCEDCGTHGFVTAGIWRGC